MNNTTLSIIALCVVGLGMVAMGVGALVGRYTSPAVVTATDPGISGPLAVTDPEPAEREQPGNVLPDEPETDSTVVDSAVDDPTATSGTGIDLTSPEEADNMQSPEVAVPVAPTTEIPTTEIPTTV